MLNKFRKIRWVIVVLILGLAFGFIVSCAGGDEDNDEDMNELSVELAWTNAVDMDLYVIEPTGEWVWLTNNGPTAISLGDNNCGFGASCNSASCLGLSCNTREGVYAKTVATGRYTLGVNSNSLADEDVTLFITIPSRWVQTGQAYYLEMSCTIPTGGIPIIAFAEFPSRGQGTISGEIAEVTCTVTGSGTR